MKVIDPTSRLERYVVSGVWWVMGVTLAIAVVNLSPAIDSYTVGRILDVNAEQTAVVWLSSALLLLVALASAAAGLAERIAGSARSVWAGWLAVGSLFAVLALDETMSLHELIGEKASSFVDVDWLPGLYAWVVVVAPVALIAALWMLRWFGRTVGWHSATGRMVAIAVGMWLLVPPLEMMDPVLDGPRLLVVVEESLEMTGEGLMLGGVLLYLVRRGIRISVDPSP